MDAQKEMPYVYGQNNIFPKQPNAVVLLLDLLSRRLDVVLFVYGWDTHDVICTDYDRMRLDAPLLLIPNRPRAPTTRLAIVSSRVWPSPAG